VVTSGHVMKMAVTPYDPPWSKAHAACELHVPYADQSFTLWQ